MKIISFFKKEAVLCISFAAAIISALFVRPDMEYFEYIDTHVLILLFCLMAVVAGIQKCGLLNKMAHFLCKGEKSIRTIIAALVLLCFFSSMLITNDVALITFVPFALMVLHLINKKDKIIFTVVMQTIAANLGSMATPVGNPQNLFLYSRFCMSVSEFFIAVLPIAFASLLLILLCVLFIKKEKVIVTFSEAAEIKDSKKLILWVILFVLCILGVFHIINDWILILAVLISILIVDKHLLSKVDYSLLITFVFFFVFAGNIARIEWIRAFINTQMVENAKVTILLTSQVISNVPAAVMLSNFTEQGKSLLLYTNIGGLGTLIASLASLISFKFYVRSDGAKAGKYLIVFSLLNVAFLIVLLILF